MNNFTAFDFFEEKLPSGGTKIPVGIHSAVMFSGLVRDQKWWDIKFTKDGKSIHKRIFVDVKPKDQESLEDAAKRHAQNNLPHVTKLLRLFLGDETAKNVQATTFEGFLQQAAIFLSGFANNPKGLVNLKVVYDKDGVYPDLPYFPDYVELHVPGQEPTLQFTPSEQEKINKGPQPKVKSQPKAESDGFPF